MHYTGAATAFAVTLIALSSKTSAAPVNFCPAGIAVNYAPVEASCPCSGLVRPATGLNDGEKTYTEERKKSADKALAAWLQKTSSGFGTQKLPTIGLTTSGGGYRSLLVGAGVIQGLDDRDSKTSTSGLLQAVTYQAGLSGGAWLLSSLIGNDYPTISYLKKNLWEEAFKTSLLIPSNLMVSSTHGSVAGDLRKKEQAGFNSTMTDAWGRLLAYQLLPGPDGGVKTTLSSVLESSSFEKYALPYPIITALGVKTFQGECIPGPNATTYEFSPYEFGSWDHDISAFTPTEFLGSGLSDGKSVSGTCVKNFDNLGLVLGTSSSLFNYACESIPVPTNDTANLTGDIAGLVSAAHPKITAQDEYGIYPNPFYQYNSPSATHNPANDISAQKTLSLVDGGQALQNNPLFPFLQPDRSIDVILVNDNSADFNSYPNGSEILTTYVQSFNQKLTRMPYIPSVETFLSKGLHKGATFFGCNDPNVITMVYLPNQQFSFPSNVSTGQLQYPVVQTDAMIANGVQVATQGGDKGWATCLGCAIMMKTGEKLPSECTACFAKHCYYK